MKGIEPAFDFIADESSILIHHSKTEVHIGQNTYTGNGEVRLELLPCAGIRIYGHFQGVPAKDALYAISGQTEIPFFSFGGRQIEGFSLSVGGNVDSQEFNLKWCPKAEPVRVVGDETTQMSSLIFHLFNFVDLIGTRRSTQKNGSAMHAIEHVDLMSYQWQVELKSLLSTREAMKKLNEEGGYRLTHVGGVKKVDGTTFSGTDAQDCLRALRYFLSFAKGGWCEPVCAVGFDGTGNRVWESWASPRESWHVPLSWFDPHTGLQLAILFPTFMKKWENTDWRDALDEIIYWYLNANHSPRGIDAGIILTQAALERLITNTWSRTNGCSS
jgi:hypothetical protein